MRWYAFPCFPRMTNRSAANVSKRGIPLAKGHFVGNIVLSGVIKRS